MTGNSEALAALSKMQISSKLIKRDGMDCQWCGADLSQKPRYIDHVYPASRGGSETHLGNLQLLCKKCGQSKGEKTLSEWELVMAASGDFGSGEVRKSRTRWYDRRVVQVGLLNAWGVKK